MRRFTRNGLWLGLVIVVTSVVVLGPRSSPRSNEWWLRSYDDPIEVAQTICDESDALDADPSRAGRLAPLLRDRRVVYAGEPDVEAQVRAVTVRDMAYTILDEAGLLPLDPRDRQVKLIAACQVDGEMGRIHMPILDDRDFEAALSQLLRRMTRIRILNGVASIARRDPIPCCWPTYSTGRVPR